ncbi:MAG: DoxX family protein [Pseudomonadota bacterium]
MKNKIAYGLQILLALIFLAAGIAKLSGVPMLVQGFELLGLGQWFRYLTGIIEISAALILLVPTLAGYAAALLSCVMAGAIIAHLTRMPGSPVPALVLLVLCGLIAWFRLLADCRPARSS